MVGADPSEDLFGVLAHRAVVLDQQRHPGHVLRPFFKSVSNCDGATYMV
jgi:hypothetical protein